MAINPTLQSVLKLTFMKKMLGKKEYHDLDSPVTFLMISLLRSCSQFLALHRDAVIDK